MKILLLDPAFAAVPIHDYLSGQGHEVWTIGNREFDALAVAHPDRWIRGDYSNVSFVRSLVKEQCFERVVPGCTDVSMDVFARLGAQPNYSYSLETDQVINRKPLFRALCEDLDLPAPRAFHTGAVLPEGRFICKPADSFSGQGVTIFDGSDQPARADAIAAACAHSATSEVVLEEFVDGELHSFTAFIENGRVATAFIVREGSRFNSFAVDTSYVRTTYDADKYLIMKNAVERVCQRLELCDGLLHTQFIDSGSRIAILEMTRRCPGDLYSMLISYSTGHNFAGRYASYFIGEPPPEPTPRVRHVLRHTIKQSGSARFSGFDVSTNEWDGLFRLVPVLRLGQPLPQEQSTRIGIAYLETSDVEALERLYHSIIGKGAI